MLDIGRLIRAIGYSCRGLRDALVGEAAFRQEAVLALILIPVAVWLGEDNVERALMIGVLFIVLIVELLNSAIEAAVDRMGSERNELAQKGEGPGFGGGVRGAGAGCGGVGVYAAELGADRMDRISPPS